MSALLEVRGLAKHFPIQQGPLRRRRGWVRAVDGVDLELERGECLALVGESGSGKTTLGRCAIRLDEPSAGTVELDGEDIIGVPAEALRRRRRRFQMIFQDPYGSLDPRMRVDRILMEPLEAHDIVPRARRRERVGELLEMVGMTADAGGRFPHQFSGGQRQRIGIARALATKPDLVVADEPVSALDVSVRAQILNLLLDLRRRFDLAMLFIAHDLALVEQIADRAAVMYLGRIVEQGPVETLFAAPRHPYTVCLLSAVPVPDPGRRRRRIALGGEVPSPVDPPTGCAFHPRCPIARTRCMREVPSLRPVEGEHRVACHYPGELDPASGHGAVGMEQSADETVG